MAIERDERTVVEHERRLTIDARVRELADERAKSPFHVATDERDLGLRRAIFVRVVAVALDV